MQRWEYCYFSAPNDHIYYFSTNQQLEMEWNEAMVHLGIHGWELVTVASDDESAEFYDLGEHPQWEESATR